MVSDVLLVDGLYSVQGECIRRSRAIFEAEVVVEADAMLPLGLISKCLSGGYARRGDASNTCTGDALLRDILHQRFSGQRRCSPRMTWWEKICRRELFSKKILILKTKHCSIYLLYVFNPLV